jgi:hypothetical protein
MPIATRPRAVGATMAITSRTTRAAVMTIAQSARDPINHLVRAHQGTVSVESRGAETPAGPEGDGDPREYRLGVGAKPVVEAVESRRVEDRRHVDRARLRQAAAFRKRYA